MHEQLMSFKISDLKSIKKIKENIEKQIKDGINKRFSSTGTPIADLHGAPKFSAIVANIGGGAKRIGGNGMKGGILTIRQYDTANTYLKTASNINSLSRKPITFEQLLK